MKRFCIVLSIIHYISAINGMIQDPELSEKRRQLLERREEKIRPVLLREINKDLPGLPPFQLKKIIHYIEDEKINIALLNAIYHHDFLRVRELISQAHANVNALVRPHLTPFIAAIERNFTSAALYMMELPETNINDRSFGWSPLRIALINNNADLARALIDDPRQKFVLSVPATNKIPSVEQTLQDAAELMETMPGLYEHFERKFFDYIGRVIERKKEPKARL